MRTVELTLPDDCTTIALAGGPYSNFGAAGFLRETAGIAKRFCLGDLGGFGSFRRFWFNVGVLGRPAHEDCARVFFGIIDFPLGGPVPSPRLVAFNYDAAPVATAMRAEGLPDVFVESLLTGRWTTCCNILPADERMPRDRLALVPA